MSSRSYRPAAPGWFPRPSGRLRRLVRQFPRPNRARRRPFPTFDHLRRFSRHALPLGTTPTDPGCGAAAKSQGPLAPTADCPRRDSDGRASHSPAAAPPRRPGLSRCLRRSSACVAASGPAERCGALSPLRRLMSSPRPHQGRPGPENMETPHPVEKKHAPRVFCFHRTKSFHDPSRDDREGVRTPRLRLRREGRVCPASVAAVAQRNAVARLACCGGSSPAARPCRMPCAPLGPAMARPKRDTGRHGVRSCAFWRLAGRHRGPVVSVRNWEAAARRRGLESNWRAIIGAWSTS